MPPYCMPYCRCTYTRSFVISWKTSDTGRKDLLPSESIYHAEGGSTATRTGFFAGAQSIVGKRHHQFLERKKASHIAATLKKYIICGTNNTYCLCTLVCLWRWWDLLYRELLTMHWRCLGNCPHRTFEDMYRW